MGPVASPGFSRPFVPSAVGRPRFRSDPARAGPSSAGIATTPATAADQVGLIQTKAGRRPHRSPPLLFGCSALMVGVWSPGSARPWDMALASLVLIPSLSHRPAPHHGAVSGVEDSCVTGGTSVANTVSPGGEGRCGGRARQRSASVAPTDAPCGDRSPLSIRLVGRVRLGRISRPDEMARGQGWGLLATDRSLFAAWSNTRARYCSTRRTFPGAHARRSSGSRRSP